MKARDIFGLVVRLLGVYFFYLAAINVPQIWRIVTMPGRTVWSLAFDSLFMVTWQGLLAWWLVRGAPPVMEWAYPPGKE